MMRRVLDVSRLPKLAFGHRDPLWWSMIMMIAIEGTMLVLLALSYLYVSDRLSPFPPAHIGMFIAWLATIEVVIWIASGVAQHFASKAAIKGQLVPMRRSLIIATVIGAWGVAMRCWIFQQLPFRWDDHAYGSCVWALLGVQFLHGLTGVFENLLFIGILFRGPVEHKHRADVHATTPLMYFVIAGVMLVWAIVFLPVLVGGGR